MVVGPAACDMEASQPPDSEAAMASRKVRAMFRIPTCRRPAQWLPALLVACVVFLSTAQAIDVGTITVTGVRDEVEDNIRATVSLGSGQLATGLSQAELDYALRKLPEEVQRAMEPFGYYDAKIDLSSMAVGDAVNVSIAVTPGEPVRVVSREIVLTGPGKEDESLIRRGRAFYPSPGRIMRHDIYEQSKSRMQRRLNERGYFDGEISDSKVEVTRATKSADYRVEVATGERYRFGETTFTGSQIREDLLRRLVDYAPGDDFHQNRLVELHSNLVEYDYFGFVDINVDPDAASADREIPIKVSLTPAKRTLYTAGVSYGTDSGGEVRAAMERRYVNSRGHKIDAEVIFGQRRTAVGALYRVPAWTLVPGWWSGGFNLRDELIGDFDTRIIELVGGRSGQIRDHNFATEWHLRQESYDGFDTFLSYPLARYDLSRGNDPLYPTRGYAIGAEVATGLTAIGSDVDFTRFRVSAKWVLGWGERDRILLRGSLGRTDTSGDDFSRLPPSLRFFAGGDRSVRGYGYNELGPRDADGDVIGGQNLAVASVEYEHMLNQRWGGAVFVDVGNAFDDQFEPRVGVGVGARWRSPIGPVRVDIGVGIDDPERPVTLHFNIGPDL